MPMVVPSAAAKPKCSPSEIGDRARVGATGAEGDEAARGVRDAGQPPAPDLLDPIEPRDLLVVVELRRRRLSRLARRVRGLDQRDGTERRLEPDAARAAPGMTAAGVIHDLLGRRHRRRVLPGPGVGRRGRRPAGSAKSWRKSPGPVFSSSPENSQYGPGHNSFLVEPDGTVLNVFHARNYRDIVGDPAEGHRPRNARAAAGASPPTACRDFGLPLPEGEAMTVIALSSRRAQRLRWRRPRPPLPPPHARRAARLSRRQRPARGRALVYAGGGYLQLMHDKEGVEIAQWLNTLGP